MMKIDRSAWVSWGSYYLGIALAWGPDLRADIVRLRPGALLMVGAIAVFLVVVMLIQRFMSISLRSATFGEPMRLVTAGVFRWSRNPIYVAFLLPLATLGLYSPLASAVAITCYLVAMTYYVIAAEEKVLSQRFGADFSAYCARTPRWMIV